MLPVQLLRTWWLGRNRHELHRGLRLLRLLRFLSLHTLTLCFMRHGRLPTFVDAGLPPVHLLRARGWVLHCFKRRGAHAHQRQLLA